MSNQMLIIGSNGGVGKECQEFFSKTHDVIPISRKNGDLRVIRCLDHKCGRAQINVLDKGTGKNYGERLMTAVMVLEAPAAGISRNIVNIFSNDNKFIFI